MSSTRRLCATLALAALFPGCNPAGSGPAAPVVPRRQKTVVPSVARDDPARVVRRILAEQLGKKIEAIEPAQTLSALGADELDLVEIVMEIEEDLNVAIADEELEKAAGPGKAVDLANRLTVGQLVALVQATVKQAGRR